MAEINSILLSAQKALLGIVTPNLRAVVVDYIPLKHVIH